MTLKRVFILLSLLALVGTLLLSNLYLKLHPSRAPALSHALFGYNADNPLYSFRGLKPEANNPTGIYYKDRVLVLMYHDVSPKPEDAGTLSVDHLDKQLQLMKDNNFNIITMSQYRDFILQASPVPENAVLLTFDDGYESLYTHAYPVLQKHNAPASAFLIVNLIDNEKYKGAPRVTWEQVDLMHKNGIEFFNHTFDSHKYFATGPSDSKKMSYLARRIFLKDKDRRETEEEYKQRVGNDLGQANDILAEKLGAPNHVLAFPYGAFSDELLEVSGKLGIDVTLTVRSGLNKTGQTNGFRLDAGGMANDPDLQLSLMKQAKKLIGNNKMEEVDHTRQYMFATFYALLVIGALWLWTGVKLIVKRRNKAGRGSM
ncbi:polysaccharide deacetylase family protein [Cohnella abietis]|uniref:NodB homology domain-containing protein n=1 Tax=Cohnella abietis TaxID=2507935 RepID=A0A3T1D6N2_9BACL|nr:polysaccharide deacetylase family protein [Cohnella abietis]BBI33740.1 hypothetical protein KCTCHS21_31390 [Cohnella abietis]